METSTREECAKYSEFPGGGVVVSLVAKDETWVTQKARHSSLLNTSSDLFRMKLTAESEQWGVRRGVGWHCSPGPFLSWLGSMCLDNAVPLLEGPPQAWLQ